MVRNTQQERKLYVGNLDPRVTEVVLNQLFGSLGDIVSIKLIPDKNYQSGGFNYAFIEFREQRVAEAALNTLNGKKVFNSEIKLNWAFVNTNREETAGCYNVFVGDVSQEVNDQVLGNAFGSIGPISEARVMWDPNSGKSRGFGFVAFKEKADAERAIATMNGEWLGGRPLRVNWANQKSQQMMQQNAFQNPFSQAAPAEPLKYETVLLQTQNFNTTVYFGNISQSATQADILPLFSNFSNIADIRIHPERGYGFIKLDSHENAAMAICSLNGTMIHGRPLKCSWGKDKGPAAIEYAAYQQQQQQQNYQQNQYQSYPAAQQYGINNPYSYYPPGTEATPISPAVTSLKSGDYNPSFNNQYYQQPLQSLVSSGGYPAQQNWTPTSNVITYYNNTAGGSGGQQQ
jgi:nucleolysin TIA-1/TIAR